MLSPTKQNDLSWSYLPLGALLVLHRLGIVCQREPLFLKEAALHGDVALLSPPLMLTQRQLILVVLLSPRGRGLTKVTQRTKASPKEHLFFSFKFRQEFSHPISVLLLVCSVVF